MDLGLTGKVAIVTGASSGFGLATAKGLAREGCRLAVCARREAKLLAAAREIEAEGAEVLARPCDVFQADQAEAFVRETAERFGGVDVLVNNVGGLHEPLRAMFEETTDKVWARTFEMNVVQSARMTRLCLPHMKARGGSGFDAHYCTAKAAMIMQSRSLAQELGRFGVRINTVSPGSAWWPGNVWDVVRRAYPHEYEEMLSKTPFGRLTAPEDVADVVVFLVSERARWVHGAHIQVDGGQEGAGIAPALLAALRQRRGGKHKDT